MTIRVEGGVIVAVPAPAIGLVDATGSRGSGFRVGVKVCAMSAGG